MCKGIRTLKQNSRWIVFAVFLFSATAQAQFNYTTNNGAITITKYLGGLPHGAVVIPSTISGLPVAAIGNSAFSGSPLASITVPDSVTSIGDGAFNGCPFLANFVANGLTNIQPYAFWACNGLTNFFIPAGLVSIGNQVFFGDSRLASFTVDNLNPVYSSLDGVLFDKNQTTLMLCPQGKSGSYTVPDSVIGIVDGAFFHCANLNSVKLPNGVLSITVSNALTSPGATVFMFCFGLTNVSLGTSLTNIGYRAFWQCPALTSVAIPDTVTSIEESAFEQCSNLTSVTIGKSLTDIGRFAFESCTNLLSVFFRGDAPTNVDPTAFNTDVNAILYYLPGAHGWPSTVGGRPALLWNPQASPLMIGQNGLGFVIKGTEGLTVVVEASETVEPGGWMPLSTNSLLSGSSAFNDPEWAKHSARFYRFRSP